MIKIAIADDHTMFCQGVKSLLETYDDYKVVKIVENGELLLEYLKYNTVDVVLMDINMAILNGVEASKIVLKFYPKIKIIVLSMYKKPVIIRELLELGVHGYVLKDAEKGELVKTINHVLIGNKYFDSRVMEVFMDQFNSANHVKSIQLTPREKEILKLICKSYTSVQIADELNISQNTVESHRKNLLAKTSCNNSIGLVKFAYENELN
jgi:DNA-binding NarL/FixJ family response regulator